MGSGELASDIHGDSFGEVEIAVEAVEDFYGIPLWAGVVGEL